MVNQAVVKGVAAVHIAAAENLRRYAPVLKLRHHAADNGLQHCGSDDAGGGTAPDAADIHSRIADGTAVIDYDIAKFKQP